MSEKRAAFPTPPPPTTLLCRDGHYLSFTPGLAALPARPVRMRL